MSSKFFTQVVKQLRLNGLEIEFVMGASTIVKFAAGTVEIVTPALLMNSTFCTLIVKYLKHHGLETVFVMEKNST